MRKLIFSFIFAVLLGATLAVVSVWVNFLKTPLIPAKQPLTYVLAPGSSIKTLAYDLQNKGLLDQPNFLIILGYTNGTALKLKAGEYLFVPGTTPTQLLQQIASGKMISHRFTIIEGWTFKQILAALNKEPNLTHTITSSNPIIIMNQLGVPPRNPEGLFLPATYRFTKGTTDVAVLRMAYKRMSSELAKAWDMRTDNLIYKTPYEVLIAASLVEKETAQADERPIVAGVILRRLQNNMPLQIDSTLIYGLGENYTGKLDRNNLTQDTLYNTYLHRGLPPTPISMPSLQAIEAVLHPDNSSIMYFVAKGDGTHEFSTNLQTQNQAVNTYQIAMVFPKIGKRSNSHMCARPWYAGATLQNLLNTCRG